MEESMWLIDLVKDVGAFWLFVITISYYLISVLLFVGIALALRLSHNAYETKAFQYQYFVGQGLEMLSARNRWLYVAGIWATQFVLSALIFLTGGKMFGYF